MLLVSLSWAPVLGFLTYNFHPARIFMGDSGSLLAGFLLAVTAITGTRKARRPSRSACPSIFAVPLSDTMIAIGRRLLTRRPGVQGEQQTLSDVVRRC